MALDASRKGELAGMETSAFMSQTSQVKAYIPVKGNYNGELYTIYKDFSDPEADTKEAAVHEAVKKIKDKGLSLPKDLRVYCTKAYEAQNRAFSRTVGWTECAYVILGSTALKGGRADALSATGLGGCKPVTITCIHEIGHILHERVAGDNYWEKGSAISAAGKAVTAGEVSGYAGSTKKEFVAEVFAGLILGRVWSANCLNEYAALSGPVVP